MKSAYDSIAETDKDQPQKRAEWNKRGREAPNRASAAGLRLRAYQQKMALRALREAQALKSNFVPQTAGWVNLGPAPIISWSGQSYGANSGRITAVAIDPSDNTGNTVYAGGAYGGVWRSTNGATSLAGSVIWTPVTDQQASLATGAISIKPDGSVILVGTGEPNSAIDSYYGVGILYSTNGGANWTLVQSADSGSHPFVGLGVAKFAWSTANGQTGTVVAATATTAQGFEEGLIGSNTSRGLYLSQDSAQHWAYQAPTDGSLPISATDVVYNPSAGKFFAAIRYHGVYSSSDGRNWTRLPAASQPGGASGPLNSTNCPTNVQANGILCPIYRGQFAVVPGRNEMYFWFVDIDDQDEGIWQSLDGGGSWKQVQGQCTLDPDGSFCGVAQAFYDLEIAAVPDGSATDLYAGAINLFKWRLSSPGNSRSCSVLDNNIGADWINLTQVYTCPTIAAVHPDEHGLDFQVINGKELMYFGNDGGVYRALDGYTGLNSGTCGTPNNGVGVGFEDLNNPTLGSLSQFVSFSVHPTDQDTLLGGTQDNGSPATTDATGNSPTWFTANHGDGGYSAINPDNPSQWFTEHFYLWGFYLCNTAPNCDPSQDSEIPISIGGDLGDFYTPYILDPQNAGAMLIGTCRVWTGSTAGGTFTALSHTFDGSFTCPGFGGQVDLVRGIAAGGPTSNGLSNVVYATTNGTGPLDGSPSNGEVWATTNAASTLMTNVTGNTNPSHYTISSVAIDNSVANGQTAYVGIMGFGVSHVWKTTNAGGSWMDFTGSGLPDEPVNALLVDSTVTPARV